MELIDAITASLRWAYTTYGFRDRPATQPAKITVAEIHPNNELHTMALDIAPGNNCTPHPANGYAWVDVMDRSTIDHEGLPTRSARVGIKPDCIEVGSLAWDGATPLPIHLIIGGVTAVEIRLDPTNNDPVLTIKGRIKARGYDIIS
jgi:hypothetical protein